MASSFGSCFGLYTDLNFCTKYSYMGQMLNSCPDSFVCRLLSLKCHTCQMDSKRFLLSVKKKWVWSLSPVRTMSEDRNCLHKLVVGTSLSLSKISLSLLQRHRNLYPHITHKILSSCRTLLCRAMIATEGS